MRLRHRYSCVPVAWEPRGHLVTQTRRTPCAHPIERGQDGSHLRLPSLSCPSVPPALAAGKQASESVCTFSPVCVSGWIIRRTDTQGSESFFPGNLRAPGLRLTPAHSLSLPAGDMLGRGPFVVAKSPPRGQGQENNVCCRDAWSSRAVPAKAKQTAHRRPRTACRDWAQRAEDQGGATRGRPGSLRTHVRAQDAADGHELPLGLKTVSQSSSTEGWSWCPPGPSCLRCGVCGAGHPGGKRRRGQW